MRLDRSAGGLANGLREPHARGGSLWVGWPGLVGDLDDVGQAALEERLAALRMVPVWLGKDEVERYYDGFCNGVLWPLFHDLIGHVPLVVQDFDAYETVNARFADAVADRYRPGDLVWVHDYQLMRLPALLRERLPEARIGFFLHIPFPTTEAFRAIPVRERLLEGLLGADLIGFHTAPYLNHCQSAARGILAAPTRRDRIDWQGRRVRLGVFPMGVDTASFAGAAGPSRLLRQGAEVGDGRVRLLVGIDRLDYTKGIPRRLLAFEQLLREHPELRERVQLVQVAVPSRTGVEAYRQLREQVEGLVRRINRHFATPAWLPIQYRFQSLPAEEIVTLYRAADAMLVTPIRDGMNLVAKEFVASRTDEDGVLVLSEFAGAAAELTAAIPVNPYDVDGTAEACHRALTMPRDERRTRMRALRRSVLAHDVHRWVRTFLDALGEGGPRAEPAAALGAA
ncbi:MAG: trehalose-6-phosphate synthase, partial [Candidatus Rokuibacteriota bacterium]